MRTWSRAWLAVLLAGVTLEAAAAGPPSDATVAEQAKLLPEADPLGGELGALFARSVATEGALALIGVPSKDLFTGDTGVAHVFVRQGTVWSHQAQLIAPDNAANDRFGIDVALSGATAVVGADLDDTPAGADAGSVHVFVNSGSAWNQQAQLVAGDAAAGDRFGNHVSVQGDWAVIGAPLADGPGGADAGAVYVFERSGSTWTQHAKLQPADLLTNDQFGFGVDVDGDRVVVAAPRQDLPGKVDAGAVYVFVRSGAIWTQETKLSASDSAANAQFGASLSISFSSSLLAVGAPRQPPSESGAAYSFRRSGGSWVQEPKLVAADAGAGDHFGHSVSLDGTSLAVGAPYDDTGAGTDAGSSYVFVRAVSWSQQQKLEASDGQAGAYFGYATGLAGDTLVSGAPLHETTLGAQDAGAAYVHVRSGTLWSAQQRLQAPDGTSADYLGYQLAADGNSVALGSYGDDTVSGLNAGSVTVFVWTGSTWLREAKLFAPDPQPYDQLGTAVAIQGNRLVAGAYNDDTAGGTDVGSVYTFVRGAGGWTFEQKLEAPDGLANDRHGLSMALDGDTLAVSAPYVDDGSLQDSGAVYVYRLVSGVWTFEQKLTPPSPTAVRYFGYGLGLSDGFLAIGDLNVGPGFECAVRLYTRSGSVWSEVQTLAPGSGTNGFFGQFLSISGDRLAIAAPFDDEGATNAGRVYSYRRVGATWLPTGKLQASDPQADANFGSALAVRGQRLMVGARLHDGPAGANSGQAYLFSWSGIDWDETDLLRPSDAALNDQFGSAVGLLADFAIVGSQYTETPSGLNSGAGYVFVRETQPPSDPTSLQSTSHTPGTWSALNVVGMQWQGATDGPSGSGVVGYSVLFDAALGTLPDSEPDVVQQSDPHSHASLPLPDGANHYFHLRTCDLAGNCSNGQNRGPYLIDTAAPSAPPSLASPSHPTGAPRADATIDVAWTAASDATSGIAGYAVVFDAVPAGPCDGVQDVGAGVLTATSSALADGSWYAHVCARDLAGNWGAPAHAGPLVIDTSADLSIVNSDGATSAIPGQSTTYTLSVSNAGLAPVAAVGVSDAFPAALTCTWTCAPGTGSACSASGAGSIADSVTLAAGGGVVYTASCSIAPGATGTLVNTATVAAPAGISDPNLSNNTATDSDTVLQPTAQLGLTKTDNVSTAVPGQTVTYTLVASNSGPSHAPGAVVSDTFPAACQSVLWVCTALGGASCTASGVGSIADTVQLPAGGSVSYTALCSVAPAATGTLANTAGVQPPAGVSDPQPADNSATDSDTLTPVADLSVSKTDGLGTAVPGSPVTYTIVVSNSGPSSVSGAGVSDVLPGTLQNATWTCAPSVGASCTPSGSGSIADSVTIPPGGSLTYTLGATILPSALGNLTNAVSASAPAGVSDPNAANDSASDTDTLTPLADLHVTQTDSRDPVPVFGTWTYTVTLLNQGPSAASSVTLADTLPAGVTLVSFLPAPPECVASSGGLSCALGDLAAGQSRTVSLTVSANAGTLGSVTNGASASGAQPDPDASDDGSSESTLVRFAKGDVDNDLGTDLLLRNLQTGENVAWLMNGVSRLVASPLNPATPSSLDWRITAADDFDGDNRNDLLFWDAATGAVEFWLMNGTERLGAPVPLGGAAPLPIIWKPSASADFNLDGHPDVVFRNYSTQKIVIWTMNGTNRVSSIVPQPDQAVDGNWEIVAALDYDGDTDVDFLWYNWSSGKIVLWWMNAAVQRETGQFTVPPQAGNNNWKVLASGDYGIGPGGLPGTNDVVWRNSDSGRFVVWYLDQSGNRTTGIFTNPDSPEGDPLDWTIVGPR